MRAPRPTYLNRRSNSTPLTRWLVSNDLPYSARVKREDLVPPVEVAGAAPEGGVLDWLLRLRGEAGRLLGRDELFSVHRLLDPRLLLGLEERVVLEWVCCLVAL